jgi:CheY-like chemotaxis protein
VLVVEDDVPIRVMVTDLLSDAGYGVTEAQTGHEALSRLHERRPDLIVLDLMLPGMSGWEFLDRAREQLARAKIPVMIFSAIHGKSDYPATLGVAAWFTKPLDIPRFLGAVEQLAGVPHFAHTKRSPLSSTSARILIVEDESTIRDLVTEQLDGAGYMTDAVGSTTEAWQRIDAHRPDLILLDLMLPVEDGWTFLHRRRDDTLLASIPVVVISAAPHARLLEAKTIGADAFLSKPFDLEALTALVRSFVG